MPISTVSSLEKVNCYLSCILCCTQVKVLFSGLKRLETPKADAIIKAKKQMKTRKIHDVVDKIKANPPKPRKPRPPKPTLLPIPKEQSPTAPSPPTPTGHSITSPSRKMIPPSKSYVPIQPTPPKASDWKYAAIPSAKPVVQNQPLPTQTSNHMMSRKRSHDGGQVQQNGIDGKILEIIRFQDEDDYEGKVLSILSSERASFWRKNMVAVVILLRVRLARLGSLKMMLHGMIRNDDY